MLDFFDKLRAAQLGGSFYQLSLDFFDFLTRDKGLAFAATRNDSLSTWV